MLPAAMRAHAEHEVDDAGQNDEPGNQDVNGHGSEKGRTDRNHAEHNQQNTPKN